MVDDGEPPPRSEARLPSSQTWRPRGQRLGSLTLAVASGLFLAGAVVRLLEDGDTNPTLFVNVMAAVGLAVAASLHYRTAVTADAHGLHVRAGGPRTTYPWRDIVEIRPSIARGIRYAPIVLVLSGRRTIDLPVTVTEEHLDELRRWHTAAGADHD